VGEGFSRAWDGEALRYEIGQQAGDSTSALSEEDAEQARRLHSLEFLIRDLGGATMDYHVESR